MSLTEREKEIWDDLKQWEDNQFSNQGTDFSSTYQKMVHSGFRIFGGKWSSKLLTKLDDILFQLQVIIQQGTFDVEAKEKLFCQARIFRSDIHHIEDMKKLTIDQLRFIARKQLAKQRITALTQGGLTGLGGFLFTLSDLPLMLAINLRTTQLMALTYGYDLRKPYEMMLVLKLFHTISLPSSLQKESWDYLQREVKGIKGDWIFYEGEEDILSEAWMQRPLNNIFKLILLSILRKKVINGIPIIGIATGAAFNYQFSNHIAECSHRFYQKRWLLDKQEE
ncbi:EcsC family protein [Evansella sp. AB-P1]|uniref:EcsC family protein n=1 Tax=Evansella sp. AB-P1 TaxID=3037653 RepID=UPI00241C7142|nr:EcsC family protein [Evansella sp. AB-P1]MDG5786999.1 EcsC family protein [Evansella sp. AB-P1]